MNKSLSLLKMKSGLWLSPLHFTSWMLILCVLFFFFLFLFFLQVLKCHPPVLGSYLEHMCQGRGQMEAGEEEGYE